MSTDAQLADAAAPAGVSLHAVPRIRRTHIALFVKDPYSSAPWYEDVLGIPVAARGPPRVFLSFGPKPTATSLHPP